MSFCRLGVAGKSTMCLDFFGLETKNLPPLRIALRSFKLEARPLHLAPKVAPQGGVGNAAQPSQNSFGRPSRHLTQIWRCNNRAFFAKIDNATRAHFRRNRSVQP